MQHRKAPIQQWNLSEGHTITAREEAEKRHIFKSSGKMRVREPEVLYRPIYPSVCNIKGRDQKADESIHTTF